MSRTQIAAVAITVALSALDGYDVLSVTFAAPAIVRDWGIGKAGLGVVLSAGLAGMATGSLALAPLADAVGRRRLVLGSLVLMAAGMLLSASSGSIGSLAALRVLTGLGIGAMVAVINPLAAEFASAKRRALALALMTIGYPAGGLVGGLLAARLLAQFGWRAVFVAGFVAACLLIPLVLRFLPEPLGFLLSRQRPDSLARANALLKRCGHPPLPSLPEAPRAARRAYAAVFAPGQRAVTARITAVNLLYVLTVYYVLSWLPQLVADLGFPPSTSSLVAATANLAGIAGGVVLGWLAQRGGLRPVAVAMMAGTGLATIALGVAPASLPLIVGAAALCGFFLFGGMAGLYATLAGSFEVAARASGVGFVIGIGRVGSATAPLIAGWLFASGLSRGATSVTFGSCAIVAGALLITAGRRDDAV